MQNIEKILEELYEIDPNLKSYEKDLRLIILEMYKAKPDTKFDKSFMDSIKNKLLSNIKKQDSQFSINNVVNIFMNKNKFLFATGLLVLLIVLGVSNKDKLKNQFNLNTPNVISNSNQTLEAEVKVEKFGSKEELLAYLEAGAQAGGFGYGIGGGMGGDMSKSVSRSEQIEIANPLSITKEQAFDRVSNTNVQVKGIDEPDIVKTNGKEIFVSTQNFWIYGRMPIDQTIQSNEGVGMQEFRESPINEKILPSPYPQGETKVIGALPPDKIKQIGKLPRQGEMLLQENMLMVFEGNMLYGFDISNPEKPEEKWKNRMENSSLLTARLMDGKIYMVTQSYLDYGNPCPIRPLVAGEKTIEVLCTDIYHPIAPVSDTATYHAFKINPKNGDVEKNISFLGSSGQSVVYMSEGNLYITYVQNLDQVKILADFLKNQGKNLLPKAVTDKIAKLLSYDISSSAKQVELSNILQKHYSTLNVDDRRTLENEMENKLADYLKQHMRDLVSTGIAKIGLKDFAIKHTGFVPGILLNQFSLDEYKGNLRVATTISGQGTIWGGWRNDSSANDVYVLDNELDIVGSIKDLGLTERIYSARFLGERGFLVTFRQTDPFYVLDLSEVKNPKMAGELKIPGFSSYLHPLKENLILGIGQENGRVKLSLFDVSDSLNPKEVDKYTLDEYYSEAQNNHHAFLQDAKHQIFFLPGSQTGYIVSYEGEKLSLKKAVGKIQAQRALYINNNLYIVGSDRVVVLNEGNWERVGELVY